MHSPHHLLLHACLCAALVTGSLFLSSPTYAASTQQIFLPLIVGTPATPDAPATPNLPAPLDSEEEAAVDLTNAYRASSGCAALAVSPELVAAAEAHSSDMATHIFLKHEGSDSSEPWDRATAAGYVWSKIGENILTGMTTGESAMALWEDSPGHKANLITCAYQDTGIARVQAANGDWYWTQIFGKPGS